MNGPDVDASRRRVRRFRGCRGPPTPTTWTGCRTWWWTRCWRPARGARSVPRVIGTPMTRRSPGVGGLAWTATPTCVWARVEWAPVRARDGRLLGEQGALPLAGLGAVA